MTDVVAPGSRRGSASSSIERFGYQQQLKRSLGLFDLVVYGLVIIVPVAPMATFGIVYNLSHGMVPLVYAVGLVAIAFTAFSYVMMSQAFPVAGSAYAYARLGAGEALGFLAGWAIILDYVLAPVLIYVLVAVAIQAVLPDVPRWMCIIGGIGFNTLFNLLGIEVTARLNRLVLCAQIAILALFLVLGSAALARGVVGAHLSVAPLFRRSEFHPSLIFGGISVAVLSFLGFDAVSTLSEETRSQSGVGQATMISLAVAGVLFIAQTYLASLFVLGRTSFPPGQATDGAIYGIAGMVGGAWFTTLLSVKFLVAGLPAALAAQGATARILFSMARDGRMPRMLAQVHHTRKVPGQAILLVAGIHLVLGLIASNELQLLASMVNFGALIGFLAVHFSVIVHFTWRQKSRAWIRHLLAPLIGSAIILVVLFNMTTLAKAAGVAWLIIGIIALIAFRPRTDCVARPSA